MHNSYDDTYDDFGPRGRQHTQKIIASEAVHKEAARNPLGSATFSNSKKTNVRPNHNSATASMNQELGINAEQRIALKSKIDTSDEDEDATYEEINDADLKSSSEQQASSDIPVDVPAGNTINQGSISIVRETVEPDEAYSSVDEAPAKTGTIISDEIEDESPSKDGSSVVDRNVNETPGIASIKHETIGSNIQEDIAD